MAKLRNFQFLRNNPIAPEPFASYGAARAAAETAFAGIDTLLDGEIALYSYKLTTTGDTVHTLLGIKRNGGIEILGNYDELTTEYQSYVRQQIENLDSSATIATVKDGVVTLKTGIVQENGTVANITDDEGIKLEKVATTGAAADVTVATGIVGLDATNVQGALAELQGDITALQAIDPIVTTVVEGTGIKVTDNGTGNDHAYTVAADFTVDTKKYPTESTAEGYDADKAGKTYIRIMDGETVISETDAAAFVKDGFLQEVELIEASEGQENVLRFTWNSDAGVQVTDIKVSDLCDVYTADETYLHLNGFKFEHKTSGVTAGQYGADAAATLETAGESITFNVPSITVDAAGHITVAEDKAIKVALPASIDTAIQGGAGVDTTYIQTTVNRNATETNQLDVTATAIIGNYADENQKDGLATTTATKTYVDTKIDALEITTKVTNGVGIKLVDDVVEGSNDHKYTVSLAEVERNDNPNTAGLPSASSFADDTTTFTYVKAVNTDDYGRVTGIVTETVTEFFDAGTY